MRARTLHSAGTGTDIPDGSGCSKINKVANAAGH